MPEISVVVPSYNHAVYIGDAVKSVLSQSFKDLELIVVDDGSKDNSLEILSGFTDPRLRVITQTNQGAHVAINRGIKSSTGKYIAILNSDDVFHPLRLEKLLTVLKSDSQIGLTGSYIEIIGQSGNTLGIKHGYKDAPPWNLDNSEKSFRATGQLHKIILTENYLSTTSNFVFSREALNRIGDFRPLRYAHDWDFALRMAQWSKISLLPEALLQYRVHPANTIRENHAAMIFEICWCLAVHLPQHLTSIVNAEAQNPLELEQALNSIYNFDMDRVLSVMLLQNLAANPCLAAMLLEPTNPYRKIYMDFIYSKLKRSQSDQQITMDYRRNNIIKRALNNLRRY